MTSRQAWTCVVALAVVGLGGVTRAGKVVNVGAKCPDDGSKRQIDADGLKDLCVLTAEPICPEGTQPVVDTKGEEDRCLKPGQTGDGVKPSCRSGLQLKKRQGEDSCERSEPPTCRAKFRLKVQPGEDLCEH